MCLSNTTSCSDWETYATSKSWTLTSGDGTKTVYAWYRDEYGNTSEYVNDTIILDTTIPTVTASISYATATLQSSESGTYCINTSSTRTDMSSCVASGSTTANTSLNTFITASGTYYVHVKDSAGNIGISSSLIVSLTQFGTHIYNVKTRGFSGNIDGSYYRYQGVAGNVDNYVCFGTIDKNTCLNNQDKHMYRIVFTYDSVDTATILIKETAINRRNFHSSATTNVLFKNSDVFAAINGSEYLTNTTYVPSNWKSKLVYWANNYGDAVITNANLTASGIRSAEFGDSSAGYKYYVRLITLSEYYYAYQSGGLNCYTAYATCKTSWIYNENYNVMMTYYLAGLNAVGSSGNYYVWTINGSGQPYPWQLTSTSYIRPVIGIQETVNYISGSGTSSDPFIIF